MDSVIIKIAEIIKKYSAVTKVILFGSRARGDNTPKSDYDIAINAPSIDISTKNLLLDEIEQVDTLHKMDIVFISSKTDNKLLENIQRDGKIIMDKFQIKLGNYEKAISRLHEADEIYERIVNEHISLFDDLLNVLKSK